MENKKNVSNKATEILANSINNVHKKDREVTDMLTTFTTVASSIGLGMMIEFFIHKRHWNKELAKAKTELEALEAEVNEEEDTDEQTE